MCCLAILSIPTYHGEKWQRPDSEEAMSANPMTNVISLSDRIYRLLLALLLGVAQSKRLMEGAR